MVRHDALVDPLRVHTRNYSDEARARLGLAVVRARESAGHPWRPSFAEAAGISVRSLVKLEKGDPVGPPVYEAAARAISNWTEDTPVIILEGGSIPSTAEDEVVPDAGPVSSVGLSRIEEVKRILAKLPEDEQFEIVTYLTAFLRARRMRGVTDHMDVVKLGELLLHSEDRK